jgi:hypothetical protein
MGGIVRQGVAADRTTDRAVSGRVAGYQFGGTETMGTTVPEGRGTPGAPGTVC